MSTSDATVSRGQKILSWVLSGLLLFPFLPSAFFKIAQPGNFLETWSTDFPAGSARPIGLVELACVVLYFVPRTSVLGAILMTGYLGGAVATHVHKGEIAAIVPIVVGIIAWVALWLRTPLLRRLTPTVQG